MPAEDHRKIVNSTSNIRWYLYGTKDIKCQVVPVIDVVSIVMESAILAPGTTWSLTSYVWFTFSPRQYETRRKREYEGYIRLIFYILDLFSACLEALVDMRVKKSRVKGNENISNVLPCYRRFSHKSVNVYICAYFVSFTSCQKSRWYPRRECKPDFMVGYSKL